MFRSQLSLFIAPSAGRMAVTLSPGSAPSPTVLHSGPFNPPSFSSFLFLPQTNPVPVLCPLCPCPPHTVPLPTPLTPRLRARLPAGLRH